MYRSVMFKVCIAIILSAGALQAQSQFNIHAASSEPVAGWQKMDVEGNSVWMNPMPALTSADIDRAIPNRGSDGMNIVTLLFSEAGAKKMREFSQAQINKLAAMVLDGKIVMAPKIRGVFPGPDRTAMVTGNGPMGLTVDQVQRILVSVNRSQK